jgi:hypothetical protein
MAAMVFLRRLLFAIRWAWTPASFFRLLMDVGEAFPGVFTANPFPVAPYQDLNVDRFMLGTTSKTVGPTSKTAGRKPAFSHQTDQHPKKCLDPGQRRGQILRGITALQPSHNAPGSVGSKDASRDGGFHLCLALSVNQVFEPQRSGSVDSTNSTTRSQ